MSGNEPESPSSLEFVENIAAGLMGGRNCQSVWTLSRRQNGAASGSLGGGLAVVSITN